MTWHISIGLTDRSLKHATTGIYIPSDATLAQAQAFALEYARLVEAITQASVGTWHVTAPRELDFTGMKPMALQGADHEEKGVFTFRSEDDFRTSVTIPSFYDTLIVPSTDVIDTADTDVAAFIAAVSSGIDISGTVIQPCDERGDDITDFRDAYERFKPRKKRRFF